MSIRGSEPGRAAGEPGRHPHASISQASPAPLRVTGLPDDFAAAWSANRALYPRGVDLILCAGASLAALPRTTMVERA